MARRIVARSVIALVLLGSVPAFVVFVLDVRSLWLVPFELAAIFAALIIDRRVGPIIDRRVQGVRGEETVGAILEDMSQDGWRSLHDCVLGRGNIDHITIGPGGLFTIETKSQRGRIDVDRLDEHWLKQAFAERKTVEEAVGCRVDCLLVFSNAYLSKAVSRRRGVLIMPARLLSGHLTRRDAIYSPDEVAGIYELLLEAVERKDRGPN